MTARHPHPASLEAAVLKYVRRFPWGVEEEAIRAKFDDVPDRVGPALTNLVRSRAIVKQGLPTAPTYRIPARTESDLPPIPEPVMNARAQNDTRSIPDRIVAHLEAMGEPRHVSAIVSVLLREDPTLHPGSIRASLPKMARKKTPQVVLVKPAVYGLPCKSVERPDGPPASAQGVVDEINRRAAEHLREKFAADPDVQALRARLAEVEQENAHLQRKLDGRDYEGKRLAQREGELAAAHSEVAALRKRLEDADREVDAAQDLLNEVAKDRDDAHRAIAEARATIESLREEQRQDHAELDAIDAAIGFGPGTTRSEGDRARAIGLMNDALAERDSIILEAWGAFGFHPTALPSRTLAEQCERAHEMAMEARQMLSPSEGMPPEAVAALLDLTEHVGDAESFAALRRLLVALGVARG
jgi:hypothetical protein